MMRSLRLALAFVLLLNAYCSVRGAEPEVIDLWPGKPPGDFGQIGPERIREAKEAPTPDAKWITNVTRPTLSVFAVDKTDAPAIVVCPGGGYWNLPWDLEGEEVATWLNSIGVHAIVLKYRVPRRGDQPERLPAPLPLLDAQRAVRLVRAHAADWHINPHQIGIIGFSAGGHLAVSTATNFDQPAYENIDAVDAVSCRPDFAAAIYPGYFLPQPETGEKLADYIRIPKDTPPIFLVHADDDDVASSVNSSIMHSALRNAHVPAELHIFAHGGHGFGVRTNVGGKDVGPAAQWTKLFEQWLQSLNKN